jgi:hypothetical protein
VTTWAAFRDETGPTWDDHDRPPRPAAWLRGEARRQIPKIEDEIAALEGLAVDLRDHYAGEDRRQRLRDILARTQDLAVDLELARRLIAEPPLTWDDLPPPMTGSLVARGRWSTVRTRRPRRPA